MKNNPGRPDESEMDTLRESLRTLKEERGTAGWTFIGDYYFRFDKEFDAAQERSARLNGDPGLQHTFIEIAPNSQYYALFTRRIV